MRAVRWVLLLLVVPACGADDASQRAEQAKALGTAYPDGTKGVGLLVDMLDDDNAAVRDAAAQSLVALGRKGLKELAGFLTNPRDPAYPPLLKAMEAPAKLGAALTLDDIGRPMFAGEPASRRAAVAAAILAASFRFPEEDRDFMIDTLTILRRKETDAGVTAMASASLAVLGWTVVAGAHPASAEEVKDLVPLLEEPELGILGACVISLLRPRADWPKQVVDDADAAGPHGPGGYGPLEGELKESAESIDTLRKRLRELAAVPARADDPEPLLRVLTDTRSKKTAAVAAKPDLEELLGKVHGALRVAVAKTLLAIAPNETEAPARALGEVLLLPEELPLRRDPTEVIAILAGLGTSARPAVPGLIAVLSWSEDGGGRKDWNVLDSKRAAATILGHLGAKEAVPALKALSGNGDERLRYRAATALRRIGSA